MRKLSTFDLTPGMFLSEDVLNFDRKVILSRGTELTDTLISRIELNGVLEVYISDTKEEALSDDAVVETPAPAQEKKATIPAPPPGTYADFAPRHPSFSERIKNSEEFKKFNQEYNTTTDNFKFQLNEMVDKNIPIEMDSLLAQPLSLIKSSGSSINTLDMLHNMRDYDDLTFAHCMNVALLNYVAASWLGWSEKDRETAMAAGLLHDIGKLKISHSILTKPGKLDNEEYKHIQKHPVFGYKILKALGVDDAIANSALMHHERYDGSGYPLGIAGDKIDKFARLTAVSDVYDAMTAARVYRGPLCPFRVIEIFEEEGFDKYDAQFILSFLSNVGSTYMRNACRLSDGREGEIIMLNKERLSRPVVQCAYDYVDLMKHPDLNIEALL